MGFFRKFSAAASLAVLGASGFALAAAGPAAADPGNGTLTCTPSYQNNGQPKMSCTATDPDGVHSIRVSETNSGGFNYGSATTPCSSGATTLNDTFPNFAFSSYKVVVTDCQNPASKDIYRVDAATGSVTYVRSTGGSPA
ncbi:MAG TPA: hypothetical protein VHS52_08870 [Acidimicrobiales bacterium]|jgi:hypothetical protein|nr:hypothetical protein [Acidimicrobiales bacterium]